MNREEYWDWIDSQDTYPIHSHKFIVGFYTGGRNKLLHRYLGPFDTQEQAKTFASNYKDNYTKPGFINSVEIYPLCEVL
jgi:hypothetical protein